MMLHWANKDQYYTKSGENFSNYLFTLENGKKVQFRLVEADTTKDNRKDNDQARVFALIEPKIKIEIDENGDEIQTDILPIEENGDLLTIRFEYKAVNKKEKQADYLTQAVAKIQNFAISDKFQGIFTPMPTEKNKNRTLLEKYLTDYTAKNTADYFIHKNLGKFLNQELDFYIKNEVMNLDNIQDSTDFSHIEQNLQTIKTLKTVAKEIIAFLAQLEDFQKKLWLKKKFVAGCHYLITLDHLDETQVQTALDNPKQTAQWQALFNVDTSGQSAAEICKNYPHLVVDTSLFEPKFQAEVLNELHDLDEKTNGLLIHSDNFQALNLLQERYKEQVKCIYIDPPYNTEDDRAKGKFIYKDGYPSSTWATLIHNRLSLAKYLLNQSSVLFQSIDDNEQTRLKLITDELLGEKNFLADIIILTGANQSGEGVKIQVNNEYCLAHGVNKDSSKIYHIDAVNETLRNLNDAPTALYTRPDMGYTIYFNPKTKDIVPLMDYDKSLIHLNDENLVYTDNTDLINQGYVPIRAGKRSNLLHRWRWGFDSFKERINEVVIKKSNGKFSAYFKQFGFNAPKNIINISSGTTELKNLFSGNSVFPNPKNTNLIHRIASITLSKTDVILDYFAGSGTTAHAVINLNREDKGNRKYILVEQGEYFDSVLKPRVQKVIFAKEWKDGKPQSNNGTFDGVSQIVKVLKLESYEDTLNNLELRKHGQDLAEMGLSETVQNDYLLHYMLEVESRDSLLNTQHFAKPFDYQLNIATTSAGAYEAKTIDLVETFNYLIGLRVSEIDDQREKRNRVFVKGKLPTGEKVLILWRDCEEIGYEKLNELLRKQKIDLSNKDIYSQSETFDVIYINGDHNIPTVFTDSDESVKTLKVRSIESEFLSRMFGE
ncbi:restriction endonuclease subunit M [Canicola haemoglobinophilus]|nr:restriction endonuclease subunit M [Canicola haemoglobinophilus]